MSANVRKDETYAEGFLFGVAMRSAHFSWQSAVLDTEMMASTKLVLLVIGTYMNQHGIGAFPAYREIAKASSLSRKKVIDAVALGVEHGWLIKIDRERKNGSTSTNEYQIAFPSETTPLGVDAYTPRGELCTPPSVRSTPLITPHLTPHLPPHLTLTPQAAEIAFEELWKLYPKRPGNSRQGALKCYKARLKDGATHEDMLEGIKRYAEYCYQTKTAPTFIKHMATFLGPDKHYESDWTPAKPQEQLTEFQKSQKRIANSLNLGDDNDLNFFNGRTFDNDEGNGSLVQSNARPLR